MHLRSILLVFDKIYTRFCRFAGRYEILKNFRSPPSDLRENLRSAELSVEPEEVVALAVLTAVSGSVLAIGAFAFLMLFGFPPHTALVVGPLPVLPSFVVGWYPEWRSGKATSENLKALPRLIGYLAVALKINPNLEKAAFFSLEGVRSAPGAFSGEVWRAILGEYATVGEALSSFARRCGAKERVFKRSLDLLKSSVSERGEDAREEILDRAMDTVFEGVQKRMESFVAELRMPTMMIYGIGVLLPLILLAVLPVLSSTGLKFGGFELGLIYCAFIPSALYFLKRQVLSGRPAGFDPPRVPFEGDLKRSVGIATASAVLPPSVAFSLDLPGSLTSMCILWGLSSFITLYCYFSSEKAADIREMNGKLEEEFPDALTQMGNQLKSRLPPEKVFSKTATIMEGSEVSKILEKTAMNLRTGNMTVEEALFDPRIGSLQDVHVERIGHTFRLMTDLLDRSTRAAGEAVLQISDHLERTAKMEERIRRSLGNTVSSMRSVVLFFAPLVASVTVQVQNLLSEKTTDLAYFGGGVDIETSTFLTVLGLYIVVLTSILTSYTVEIEHGDDAVMKKVLLARTLPVSMTVFTFGLVVGRQILMILVG